jgi:PST family polysaccharide transporter
VLDRIKRIRREKKQVIENIISLSALNGINYIFPVLVIPYLLSTLGVEKYGIYAFAFAVYQYFVLVVNYGFQFSATREISISRTDLKIVSKVFSSVTTLRLLLSFFCLLILLIGASLFDKMAQEKIIIIFGAGILIGTALTPLWLFQGMEKMKFITLINSIPKLLSTALIFVFVNNPEDYIYVILFQSIGFFISGIFSIALAIKIFRLKFVVPGSSDLIHHLKDGWHIFLSTISMSFYRESNVIILGLLTNFTVVGYYASAEKVIKAVQSLTAPVTQALFPHFSQKLNDNSKDELIKTFNYWKPFSFILATVTIFLVCVAPIVNHLFLGENYNEIAKNVQILGPVIIFGGLNYFLGIIILINIGQKKAFLQSVLACGVISILSSVVLSSKLGSYGASIAMTVAEFSLFVLLYMKVLKKINSTKVYHAASA